MKKGKEEKKRKRDRIEDAIKYIGKLKERENHKLCTFSETRRKIMIMIVRE